ncbi:hypothetical protein [Ornithinimicrobium sediminis]|uniref:hypothetical protein n=1 Tax=Ornithinimicrobium sediminis TaxID=2904603 RepID=UPI001E4B4C22|nr:hypothetical protein [Ornithinimicrobium sediminis]MCE0486832.1 hypothetical protein [Ornithinimicrobium sediminis]
MADVTININLGDQGGASLGGASDQAPAPDDAFGAGQLGESSEPPEPDPQQGGEAAGLSGGGGEAPAPDTALGGSEELGAGDAAPAPSEQGADAGTGSAVGAVPGEAPPPLDLDEVDALGGDGD